MGAVAYLRRRERASVSWSWRGMRPLSGLSTDAGAKALQQSPKKFGASDAPRRGFAGGRRVGGIVSDRGGDGFEVLSGGELVSHEQG